MNTHKSQIFINFPRQDSVIYLVKSYFDLNFDVIKKDVISRYSNGNEIRLIYQGPITLFSNSKLTTSSGKHLEDISHTHVVSLMFNLLTSSKVSDDFSIGFDRDRGRRKNEMNNNKDINGKYRLRIMVKHVLGFADGVQEY